VGSDKNVWITFHGFQVVQAKLAAAPWQLLASGSKTRFAQTWVDAGLRPVARLHQAWSDSVREGRPFAWRAAEGYRSQRVVIATLLAAETGERHEQST